MKQRFWSAFLVLCFCVASLVAFSPTSSAQATTVSTTLHGVMPQSLYAFNDGGVGVGPCTSSYSGSYDGIYIDPSGVVRNTIPHGSISTSPCMQAYTKEDGTSYGWGGSTSASTMMAWKNGRQLWSVDTSSSGSCNYNNSTDKGMSPTSISEGADGNLWLILVSIVQPQQCQDRLIKMNPDTGAILSDIAITSGPAPGSGIGGATPTVWTYDGYVLVVDRYGKVREFDYTGSPTTTPYQLPIPSGHKLKYVTANSDGTVFGISEAVWSATQQSTLLVHSRAGVNNTIIDTEAGGTTEIVGLVPTHDGSAVALGNYGKRLDSFTLNATTGGGTVSGNTPTPSTPYTNYNLNILASYMEDAAGDKVYVWANIDTNAGNRITSVDVYKASTATTTRVYERKMITTDPTNYPEFNVINTVSSDSVGNGKLYLAVCVAAYSTCADTSTTPNMTLDAVDLQGFGVPTDKGFKRNSYESDKLNYVAMGDSYSSGEGNPDFTQWTNRPNVNVCHRSEQHAYPELLAANGDLNLKLVDFVACSGATTGNVLFGGTADGAWHEPAQVDALSDSTDVVTITIGGNDIGFKEYAEFCTYHDECDSGSPEYQSAMDKINGDLPTDLKATYQAILNKAPNAHLYVVGYPYVVDVNGGCITFGWSEDEGVLQVIDALDDAIHQAVDDVNASTSHPSNNGRISYVEVNAANSPFINHSLCSTSPYFIYPGLPTEYSYHPNNGGHEAYASIIGGAIG